MPADVRARLARDYPGETFFEALRVIESLGYEARVTRSIVFLAAGDLDELHRFAQWASRDWRDVVFWAEYEDHDAEQPRCIRSMSEPFEA